MIHYTCDRCRKSIDADELRFSVTIEVQVAVENGGYGYDAASDELHELELQEILAQFNEEEREELTQYAYQRRQYDLCSDCQREYLKNPLAVEVARVGFSEN